MKNEVIIANHFESIRNALLAGSKKFDTAKHKDIRGYAREALTKDFLKTHLPSNIDYFTGEIIDTNNDRSSQMDLILYGSHCPKLPIMEDFNLAFIDAVIAAIEVKSVLGGSQLKKCLSASEKLKKLKREEFILGRNTTHNILNQAIQKNAFAKELDYLGIDLNIKQELRACNLQETPYIVFAFDGIEKKTLKKHIDEYIKDPRKDFMKYGPEMIVNTKKGYYLYKNNDWLWPRQRTCQEQYRIWEAKVDNLGDSLAGMYMLLANLSTAFLLRPPLVNINEYYKGHEA